MQAGRRAISQSVSQSVNQLVSQVRREKRRECNKRVRVRYSKSKSETKRVRLRVRDSKRVRLSIISHHTKRKCNSTVHYRFIQKGLTLTVTAPELKKTGMSENALTLML